MASLIENCLARLVKQGRVTKGAAAQALALHNGMQGRLGQQMGVASAHAVGALQAARVMAQQAGLRKASIAKQAIALNAALGKMNAHPRGAVAGINALLAQDIFQKGTALSVDTKTEVVFGRLDAMFGPGNEALGSKFAGLRQDKGLARLVIRENFGEDTGNQTAKQIANGWKAATDYAANRATVAGKLFAINQDWRQPQFWASDRVRSAGQAAFEADVLDGTRSGGLQVFDKVTGAPVTPMTLPAVLKTAFDDIATGGGRGGGSGAFSPEMRVFRFTNGKLGADAYLRLMEKYGPGSDLYSMMRSHLHAAAREIAFTEELGPQYAGNFRVLLGEAQAAQRAGTAKKIPIISTAYGAEKTFKLLNGELNSVENEVLAGVMGGARAWLSAVQLGGATLSAVPGDTATMALAANYNRIPAVKLIGKVFGDLATDTPANRAFAARLGLVASGGADTALTQARFADQWLDPRLAGKVANTVIRGSGLQAWTEGAKRTVMMEMLGWVADNAPKGYAATDPAFRRFLDRYGIAAQEWEGLRKTPLVTGPDGGTFFNPGDAANQKLGEKLMGALVDERHYFVLEPSALDRAVLTPSANRGTITGEIARSFGMYKTFAVSMVTTHMLRAAMQRDLSSKIGYGLALAAYTTVLGAVAIAAKDVVYGKDPRRMNTPGFWGQAMLQGGGLGILGDLIGQGLTRSDTSLSGALGGPLAAAIDAGSQLIFSPAATLAAGGETNWGATLARQMRRYIVPETFYTRLAMDRLFFDEVQTLIDPEYRRSFRRITENADQTYGQKFWWAPGNPTPQRAPNLGNVYQ